MAALTAARCIGFGCRIATDIVLPGALLDDDPGLPQIVIRREASRFADSASGPTLRVDGAALCFAPLGVAEYWCRATDPATIHSTIDVTPDPNAAEDEIAALLIATALPGLLWLQGAFILHAAAVQMPGCDQAIAIAAPSGTGKSTMLAALVARGARVLADDTICLRTDNGTTIEASGLPGGYFARAADDDVNRRFVAFDPSCAVVQADLRAIFFLTRHADDIPTGFARLTSLQGLTALLAHRHRAAIPALLGDTGRCLAAATRIARLPAYAWCRSTGSIPLTRAEWKAMCRLSGGEDDD